MEQYSEPKSDILRDNQPPAALPTGLNVLTILTFIGCGLGYIGMFASLFMAKSPETQRTQLEEAADKAGDGFAGKMVQSQLDSMDAHPKYYQNMYDYRYIMLGTMILFITLCLIGAIQMRKRRKSGFTLYSIGELAPIIVTIAILGFGGDGTWKTYIGYLLPIIFVALYAMQRKHLTRD